MLIKLQKAEAKLQGVAHKHKNWKKDKEKASRSEYLPRFTHRNIDENHRKLVSASKGNLRSAIIVWH